ncbi:hypothetical protein [Desulfurobacterium sp.]
MGKFIKEFKNIAEGLSQLARDGRSLEYRDGAIGITELISCPIKAELRRQYPDLETEMSIEINDGFFFEKAVKTVLKSKYKERFKEEKVLPFEKDGFLIDGHLDCFIDYDDETVVGIELKNTVLTFDNQTPGKPEPLIIVNNKERKINVNHKYILQARIQRYLLNRMFPDRKVETYLFIKTNIRTKFKMGKSLLVVPITSAITDEEMSNLIEAFRKEKKPRSSWECHYCIYKKHGLCEGQEEAVQIIAPSNEEEIKILIEKRNDLLRELQMVEEQLKKIVNGTFIYNGGEYGWKEVSYYEWDNVKLSKILKEEGLKASDYFMVKGTKIKELEATLGNKLNLARTKKTKLRFILPKLSKRR